MKKNNPLVSIIIPTYNLVSVFKECLNSVLNQDYRNTEIIVVDNASTDGTSTMILEKFKTVILIRNNKNLGSTGGMNAGLKKAKGKYFLFVDHDNILNPNMLTEMVRYANKFDNVGIVVPKIYYWEKRDTIWAAGTSVSILTGINYAREGKDVGQYEKIEEVDIAPANFLVKKEVIDKVGFYDDTFFVCYEDSDFCARVKKACYKILYLPNAICYHKFPFLSKKDNKTRWLSRAYYATRNKIIFMRKNSPYFLFFVLIYPVWFLIYTYQALRYSNLKTLFNFYRGMYDGFAWSIQYNKND